MNHTNLKIKEIKELIFKQQFKRFPYLNEFKKNPYTYLKARYYMYCSVLLVYFLIRSRIKPNMVSIAYGFCGIAGGVLLSIPDLNYNIIGIIIFFNKGILDWSDGHLARIKYEPSMTGHILDIYGAKLNSAGLTIGLGFFVMNYTGYEFLIYLIAVIAFLNFELYISDAKKIIFDDFNKIINNNQTNVLKTNKNRKKKIFSKSHKVEYPGWIKNLAGFFDDRARSVDFILLIMIVDIYFNFSLSLYIFLIIFTRIFCRYILSFYFGVKSKWAEKAIAELEKNINLKKNDKFK